MEMRRTSCDSKQGPAIRGGIKLRPVWTLMLAGLVVALHVGFVFADDLPEPEDVDYGFSMIGAIAIDCGNKTFVVAIPEGDSIYIQKIKGNQVVFSEDNRNNSFDDSKTIREKMKYNAEEACDEGFGKSLQLAEAKTVDPSDPEVHTVGTSAVGSVTGHFNDDGTIDWAVVNQGSDNVSVLIGIPGGEATGSNPSFSDAANYPTGMEPIAIRTGDFDGVNGDDLLTVNLNDFANGNLSLLLSNGNGTFQAPLTLTARTLPNDAAVGFLNDDSDLDIVAADTNSQRLVLLLGNGNGTFQAPVDLATPGFPTAVVATDLDLDLITDLVTDESILLGTGGGTFADAFPYEGPFQPYAVAVADVDEDDNPDLVTANLSSNTVSIYLGDGDGGVEAFAHYSVGSGAEYLEVVDLDFDDHLDILVSNYSSDHASLLWGNGDGTFEGAPVFPGDVVLRDFTEGLALADLNSDSYLDAVVGHDNQPAAILPGDAGGGFSEPVILAGQTGKYIAAGRFDNDGLDDLVFAPGASGDLDLLLRTGDFTFASATPLDLPEGSSTAGPILVDDFNNDTFVDLATVNPGSDGVSLLHGNGAGVFTAQPYHATGDSPVALASGLLDDDNLPDLAIANAGPFGAREGSVSVLLSNHPQGFDAQLELLPNTSPNGVAIADFNRDGDNDLAVSLEYDLFFWGIRVLLGDGEGGFGEPAAVEVGTSFLVLGVEAFDLDGDRNPDLIARLGDSEIVVLLGLGDGTFEPGVTIDDGEGGTDVTAVDIDSNGLLDLVTTIGTDGGITLLLNNSSLFIDGLEAGNVSGWTSAVE